MSIEKDEIVSLVRWTVFKALLVVALGLLFGIVGAFWWFYENHCACLWQECFNIILNVKTQAGCWK